MQPWMVAPPALGVAAVLLRSAFRRKGSRRNKKDEEAARDDNGLSFSCERVCTSDMLLKRLGTLAKARKAAGCDCVRAARCALARQLTTPRCARSRRRTRASRSAASQVRWRPAFALGRASWRRCAQATLLAAAASNARVPAATPRAATDACTEACQRAVCLNTHQARTLPARSPPARAHSLAPRCVVSLPPPLSWRAGRCAGACLERPVPQALHAGVPAWTHVSQCYRGTRCGLGCCTDV